MTDHPIGDLIDNLRFNTVKAVVRHGLARISLAFPSLKSHDFMHSIWLELGFEFWKIRKQCHPASIEFMVNHQYRILKIIQRHLRYCLAWGAYQDGRGEDQASKARQALKFQTDRGC